MMKAVLLAAAVAITLVSGAQAAEPYLDDRSEPAALIRSLYNAINRKEFARAYSYFSVPPADDAASYAEGYANTESVAVVTGAASEEGAAGSIYYEIPVAIEAVQTDGATAVYAGCYTLRLANPEIQEPPFTPLQIEKGELTPSDATLEEALPETCSGKAAAAPSADPLTERAKAAFRATFGKECMSLDAGAEPDAAEPETYELAFRYRYDDASQPERTAKLFRFWCRNGAYNELHVYYFADDYGELRPMQFATPELDIRYENDDTNGAVESVGIIGFTAAARLVNSIYSPEARTLTAHSLWRGIGDASSTGTWLFRDGDFTLVKYDVDASYDGEINPQTVLDYFTGP